MSESEVIRIEEMDVSDEEKELIVRALNDKQFRDTLEQQVNEEGGELSDKDLEHVAGGAFRGLRFSQVRQVLSTVTYIQGRMRAGAEVLCGGGGGCGIA
jgi:hypothetical protein